LRLVISILLLIFIPVLLGRVHPTTNTLSRVYRLGYTFVKGALGDA
jgi:hypothetical protein